MSGPRHSEVVARRRPDSPPRNPLERWQTVLAAVVAALGAVVAAVIAATGGDGGEQGDSSASRSASASTSAEGRPSVTISGFDLLPADPGETVMRFFGTATGVARSVDIYVIGRPEAGAGASAWFPAGPADRPTDDSWRVDFEVPPDAPRPLRFLAVIPDINCWPPGDACAVPPSPEEVRQILAAEGPVGEVASAPLSAP
jgi:hypothetical protein